MNKIILLFVSVLIATGIGCQSEPSAKTESATTTTATTTTKPVVQVEKKRGPVTVSGSITNAGNTNIKLNRNQTNRSGVIKDGNFMINQMIEEPGIYQLIYNGQKIPLFLRPNDNLNLNFDALNVAETIKFSGTDPISQEYLYQKSQNNPLTYQQKRQMATLSEEDFMAQADQTLEKENAFFENFKKEHKDLPADFALFEATEIEYNWAKQYNDYSLYHAFYNKNQEPYIPSPELLAYTEKLDLNNDALMVSDAYRNYLIAHVGQKASNQVQKDLMNGGKIQTGQRAFEIVETEHSAPQIKNFLLYTFFNQHFRSKGISGSEALYERFQKEVTNPAYLAEISTAVEAWKHLRKGAPAPAFAYPDAKGRTVGLEDLRGKVVYVDIWATWCGPCKIEIPHLEKLQEQFHNQPVAFVSVSIDQNAAAWADMIKKKNMTGVQLLADQAGNSQICKDYKIKGIPRFLLIDQAGNIVNAQADRPSQGTVAGEIEALLKEMG